MTKMLEAVGPERVMFGSDMPICRMRMRRIEENNTYINLIPPGLYGDPRQDSHLREVSAEEAKKLTFFMYEEILAFKRAAANVSLTRADVEKAFFGNADALIRDVRTRLG
jgi:predicted TIM-barrel fold metal-dependent hydrolase